MYYCIFCKNLHSFRYTAEEVVFKSGFHYYDSKLYHAGLCQQLQPYCKNEQPATA
ncbi:DUF3973 domain-containing protein [Paenibacillus sp. UNC451MF]|uniref:DUF3973 domain-containing protein n=1 Tax=Paenibacillus sp. UNC451MF TaxID=1449063 RepID=UPI0018CC1C0F|nr:DUF3973 domain-containing protein [Paenibacillus sp. UNC451MF]